MVDQSLTFLATSSKSIIVILWFFLIWISKLESELNEMTSLSLNFFGLNAKRKSLGFRSNRVDQIDPFEERDLIFGDFNNYGNP